MAAKGTRGELDAMQKLADAVGLQGALLLSAWCGGRQLYIPSKPFPDHILNLVLGAESFARLCTALPRETIVVPQLPLNAVKHAGQVYRFARHGMHVRDISDVIGLTPRQVQRILSHLRAPSGRLFELDKIRPPETGPRLIRRGRWTAPAHSSAGVKPQAPPLSERLAEFQRARLARAAKERDHVD